MIAHASIKHADNYRNEELTHTIYIPHYINRLEVLNSN